ncbi:MAG: GGDEF domain-containing protein [Corticimicrobacter sp.]|uniref:GGDEF domain-containing protein n=1 Tax=Corticimicrobacter sp. TaxID=2678536 RepID=UPI0032DB3473
MTGTLDNCGYASLPHIPFPLVKRMFDALPYAVSWATLPGMHIQYNNPAFDQLFGYPEGHFRTAAQLMAEAYIHERQRERLRRHWHDFEFPEDTELIPIPDIEIDILSGTGEIRTALHCGMILPRQKVSIAIFKDISGVTHDHRMLREYAFLDPLTGVANRRGLQERWSEDATIQPDRRLAFIMVDLDNFKPINDTYGHETGDAVLGIAAARLKAILREKDLVCRLGGDEFGLLLAAPEDQAQLDMICRRIMLSLTAPIHVGPLNLQVSASIGGCLYPDHAGNQRELLQRADMAMYQVKKTGKSGWRWWSAATAPLDGDSPRTD